MAFFRLALISLLTFLPAAATQDPDEKKKKEEEEFQKKVDAAIDKGCAFLINKYKNGNISDQKKAELILLTLAHSGIRKDHPFLVENINKLLGRGLLDTYNVGLRGLLLEKIDRKKYQQQLAEIAMFFIDSQCQNGQWTYTGRNRQPSPTQYAPTPTKRTDNKPLPGGTRSDDDGIPPGKPIKLPPSEKPNGIKTGDNSNTQYALLGLFAASRANIEVPKGTWEKVEQWFESKQNSDGGWGYNNADVPQGMGTVTTDSSCGSMTTAGLTALIVAKFYLGKDWKNDAKVKKGLDWLAGNLVFNQNPGGNIVWHFYYLYGVERVGMISGMKEFGGKEWYHPGAEWLIANQKDDGHWEETGNKQGDALCDDVVNTCFAILFLRRATPELKKPKDIATGDTRKMDKPNDKK